MDMDIESSALCVEHTRPTFLFTKTIPPKNTKLSLALR